MPITLSFTDVSLDAIHDQIRRYAGEQLKMTSTSIRPSTVTNLREALREARKEINPEGAALVDFVLDQPVNRELTWPELREHIDREDDREALNVLSHIQSFTSRRFGAFVLVKQGARGRTRYHLNPAYAA